MRTSTLLLILMVPMEGSAQWTPRPSGTDHFLRDISFATPDIGVAVGDSGAIVRTQDGGETWASVYSDSLIMFKSLTFPSSTVGYVSGGPSSGGSIILKTTDSGLSWSPSLIVGGYGFGAIFFTDTDHGFVGGENVMLRTADGGITWDTIPGSYGAQVSAIAFPSVNTGYFIGGSNFISPLFRTIDGGTTLQPITNGYQSIKECAQFLNDSVGFMGGWYNPLVAKTTDSGMTWTEIGGGHSAWDLHFTTADHGRLVEWGSGWGSIFSTFDGGATWIPEYSEEDVQLEGLYMMDEWTGYAVGSDGLILKTTNGGSGIREMASDQPRLAVYPSPSSDVITVDLSHIPTRETLALDWLDARGVLITRSILDPRSKKEELTIPSCISSGTYSLVLRSGLVAIASTSITVIR